MSKKKLKDDYTNEIKKFQPPKNMLMNCIKAFIIGGLICVLGQAISDLYIRFFDFTKENVGDPTVSTLILLSALFTGLGVYDKLGQFAGAGSLVPVTGFANSMASAAIEHKSEGIVLGIATNMFKIAGSVVVFGVVAAYVVGICRYIFLHLF